MTAALARRCGGFEHRLLDVAEPSSKLSLGAYAQVARDELASLAAFEDALPVLVGGAGVFLQSILDGWNLTGPERFSGRPRWPGAMTGRAPAWTGMRPTSPPNSSPEQPDNPSTRPA
jgi:tRNA A37 N6-isopentenylltransferase MiaA